jgi:hypothetical protein
MLRSMRMYIPKEISFEVSKEDQDLIDKIIKRFLETPEFKTIPWGVLNIIMDLTACKANGTPLDFEPLLSYDNFQFLYDIGGIRNYLNRETGRLEDFFIPRSARKVPSKALPV